jgi:hypothetical protein
VNQYNDDASGQFTSNHFFCAKCDAGKSTVGAAGAIECTDCDFGHASVSGGDCTICDAGRYAAEKGSPECKICSAGQYNPSAGGIECRNCDDLGSGRTSFEGSKDCSHCEAYYYWNDPVGCHGLTGDTDVACCKSCFNLRGFHIDPEESSVLCAEGATLHDLVVNPGWWRGGPNTAEIYECQTADCRSGGGKSKKAALFGTLKENAAGTGIKATHLPRARGNGTADQLCQYFSMGPMCGVCRQGAYLHVEGIVSTCVRCEDGGFVKQLAQIPPQTWALLVLLLGAFIMKSLAKKKFRKTKRKLQEQDGGEDEEEEEEEEVPMEEVQGQSQGSGVPSKGQLKILESLNHPSRDASGQVLHHADSLTMDRVQGFLEFGFKLGSSDGKFVDSAMNEFEEAEEDDDSEVGKVLRCLKICIQAYQIMGTFSVRFFNVQYPDLYLRLCSVAVAFTSFDLELLFPFSRECLVTERKDLFFVSLVVYTIAPLIFVVLCFVVYNSFKAASVADEKRFFKEGKGIKGQKVVIRALLPNEEKELKIKNNAEGVIVDKHLNGFLRVKIEGPKKDESDQREGLKPEDAKIRDLPMDHVHLKEHVDLMTTYFDTLCFTLLFFSYLIFTAVSTKVMDFFGQEYIYVHDHYGTDATVEGIGTLPRECEGDPYEGMQFGVSGSFPETKACELKVLMCVLRADYSTRCDSKVYT